MAFLLLTNANYPLAENYNNLLCYAFQLPHYFVDELLLVGMPRLVRRCFTGGGHPPRRFGGWMCRACCSWQLRS